MCVWEVRSSVARSDVSIISPQESHFTYFMQRASFLKTCCTICFLSHKFPCVLLIMLCVFLKKIISTFCIKRIPSNLKCPTPSGGGKFSGIAKYRVLYLLSMLRVNFDSGSEFNTRLLVISVWQACWIFYSDRCHWRVRQQNMLLSSVG